VESWTRTLEKVLALRPEHISAYSLIIEEGTQFYELYSEGGPVTDSGKHSEGGLVTDPDSGKLKAGEAPRPVAALPSEEEERRMYHCTKTILKKHGYGRYEISNYSLPGFECRHNKVYWTGGDYLGVGIGASSYMEGRRFRAPDTMAAYREYAFSGKDLRRFNKQSRNEAMEEYMFLGLRMTEGISAEDFDRRFGPAGEGMSSIFSELYGAVVRKYIGMGLMEMADGRIRLTDRGIDVSNVVLADFLLDDE
jgi:oxygen-independent coproporphyrinogen-3 oxidase